MGYPRILWENQVPGSTITGSAEDTGYPDDNAANWRPYLKWKASGANSYTLKANAGSGVTAQSMALVGHNLNTKGARFKLDGSDNDSDWDAIVSYVTPSDDRALVEFFAQVTYQYYRLTVDNNGGANFDLELGVFFVGNYLEIEEYVDTGFDPDRQRVEGSWSEAEDGNILASAIDYRQRIITVSFEIVTRDFVENSWLPFWNSHYDKPFIWVWEPTNRDDECYLVRFSDRTLKDMSIPYDIYFRGPLDLEMIGLLEES